MLRLAYLSLLSPPGQPAVSGVPKVSETLLREYEQIDGLDVEVFTLVDGLPREQSERRGCVRYHYLPCKAKGKTATLYYWETRQLGRRVQAGGFDIVHGQPTGEYLLAATSAGLPHVLTVHGLVLRETRGLSRLQPGFVAGWLREQMQRRAVRRADHVISISPYVDDYVRGWTKARLWPVPNPIDPEFFAVTPAEVGSLRLLCVGIVSARKNQALLVEACQRLAQADLPFECHIVGMISPDTGPQVGELVRRLGLEKRVKVKGIVSRAELLAEYAWCNAVVLPSREETSPLSLIQAMAARRLALGANAGGIPRLLAEGAYGILFSPDDPSDLVARLRSLAGGFSSVEPLLARARGYAQGNFQPRAVAEKTCGVYRDILAAARPGGGGDR